jgi:hypothetical protein
MPVVEAAVRHLGLVVAPARPLPPGRGRTEPPEAGRLPMFG